MTVEHVPQAKSQHRRLFSPPESPDQETDALATRPKNLLIEKGLKQLVNRGLFAPPHAQE